MTFCIDAMFTVLRPQFLKDSAAEALPFLPLPGIHQAPRTRSASLGRLGLQVGRQLLAASQYPNRTLSGLFHQFQHALNTPLGPVSCPMLAIWLHTGVSKVTLRP